MADLIIKGGIVLTIDGAAIDGGTVVVDGGLITYVGTDKKEKADTVIDAKGCVVMPGLINAHTHVPMTLFRSYADGLSHHEWMKNIQQAEMTLTPDDVRSGAYLGALEMIRSGTTAFADMYIFEDEVARVAEETGLRVAVGYGMIEGMNEDPDTKLRNRADFVRVWNGAADGRITSMYAPHSAASCSREFLARVKELAELDNSRIHIHLLETEDELKSMKKRYGMCSVKLLDSIGMLDRGVLAAHCIWVSDDDIDILRSKKVNIVHCPSSNMALGAGIAPVPQMLSKCINVALGTDGAASGGSLDMWKEMRAALLLHRLRDPRAMSSSKVLEMATVNGARALGIRAGVLKAGYFADIIIVDVRKSQFVSRDIVSALVHGASGCDVRTTIVGGRVLMEDGRFTLIDEEKIIERSRSSIKNITKE